MAEAILFGIMHEVLKNVGSTAIREIAAAWGFKARLENLNNTINTLKNVLLDAEDKQADSRAVRGWLESLTTVVYAADDLFDEFNTVASRKKLMGGNNFTTEVQTFFSSNNQIKFAVRVSRKIKSIREKLDEIVENGRQFDFVTHSSKERRVMNWHMSDETDSDVNPDRVIGRDEDKKAILDMLITSSSSDEEQLTVISIVGMGGMGKTALAQLIFNDPQVKACFEKRLWVCVSDVFDIKDITEKILKSATDKEIQGGLRGIFSGKKYLLVLDDVWNEDREKWLQLRDHLEVGSKGSKIMVTTRLPKVAKKMGGHFIHELQGLSEEKSWDLFERLAFEPGQAQQKSHLVKIGKEIVKKCANVPLAIRTLGSLLYGEDEKKWLSFKDKSLAKISEDQSGIMNILKLSYHHLWSPLKNCFAYCALFPKDYEFQKEMLIDLWMAEGFIIPEVNENQSLDDAAEDYFQTLLQRGFFQDVKRNEWGAITSCKMHDLMHDLAQQVAGFKCKLVKPAETDFDDKILHLSFAYRLPSLWEIPNNLKLLRTFLLPEQKHFLQPTINKSICQQLTRLSCLRVLDLRYLILKSLPSSIGKLIHLRFLNLSHTDIEELPDSITQLHNLQTLNLNGCQQLRSLPENLRELAKLRSFDVKDCYKLSHMPSGLGRLTSMNRLPKFIVSHNEELLRSKPKSSAKLSDLKELNNLRGDLCIEIHNDFEKKVVEEAVEANLAKKQGLTGLEIYFQSLESNHDEADDDYTSDDECKHDEAVLEGLKPHSNVRKLSIRGYRGQNLPSWARMGELCRNLSNLVEIELVGGSCEQVPMLSQLRHLKHLEIGGMDRVEYIEIGECDTSSSSSSKSQGMQAVFFPSLLELELHNMRNLKGWWKGVEAIESTNGSESTSTSEFCKLSKLRIINCPELKSLPYCPNVEALELKDNNERLSVLKMAMHLSTCSDSGRAGLKLKQLRMDNVEHQLMSLPKQCWHQLSSLTIHFDDKIVNTKSIGEVFETLSNSLRSLEFNECNKLRSISQGLEHLTALKKLAFVRCFELDLSVNEEETSSSGEGDEDRKMMMPWLAFKTNLRSLELTLLPKMRSLPSGLQHLTNLRYLRLCLDEKLTEIPEWISCLSSLQQLQLDECPKLRSLPEGLGKLTFLHLLIIRDCPGLTKRCQRPDGEDCPKFQHVPFVIVHPLLNN